jgi:hypothetical protein
MKPLVQGKARGLTPRGACDGAYAALIQRFWRQRPAPDASRSAQGLP